MPAVIIRLPSSGASRLGREAHTFFDHLFLGDGLRDALDPRHVESRG